MTLEERFAKYIDDYIKFDRIPKEERLHASSDLCGMLKIADLMDNAEAFVMYAEHDKLYLPEIPEDTSDEDILYLVRCGVSFSYEDEGCYIFT